MRGCALSHLRLLQAPSYHHHPCRPYCTMPSQLACCIHVSRTCTSLRDSMHLHAHVIMAGYHGDIFLMNHLITMYGRLGSVADAHCVFNTLGCNRNVVSWNVMLAVYASHGQPSNALLLLGEMLSDGISPNRASITTALNACAANAAFTEGTIVHSCIVERAFGVDVVVETALVSMYARCGSLHDAHEMFCRMPERNTISWNTVIGAHTQHGCHSEALQFFQQMLSGNSEPAKITFILTFQACAELQDLAQGMIIHSYACEYAFEIDAILGSALLDFYSKCGSLADAQRVFLAICGGKDVVLWNGLIAAYARFGLVSDALEIFEQMQVEGVCADQISFTSILCVCADQRALPAGKKVHTYAMGRLFLSDSGIANALISMYGTCEDLEAAEEVFEAIDNPSVATWNSIISVYAQNKLSKKSRHFFQRMLGRGIDPDHITFTSILTACASPMAANEGKTIHAWVVECGLAVEVVGNALISMYARCDTIDNSLWVFSRMHKENKDSWNVMIGAHIQNSQKREVLLLLQKMSYHKVSPDKITYIMALKACDDAEALTEGRMLHLEVSKRGYDSECAMGSVLIHMYGNCNKLLHAKHVFSQMQLPDIVAWNSIIKAYAQHGLSQGTIQLFTQMCWAGMKPDKITYVSVLFACGSLAALAVGELVYALVVDHGFESDNAIQTALGTMYGKCGSVEDAGTIFAKLEQWDAIAWTALVTAHAQNGCIDKVLHIFGQMVEEGLTPDEVGLLNILFACSHTGLLEEGKYWFCLMTQGHGMAPTGGHYNCLIDLETRAGRIEDADNLLKIMPLKPQACDWISFLGVCEKYDDWERAEHAAEHIVEMDPDCFMFLSNFHNWQEEVDVMGA